MEFVHEPCVLLKYTTNIAQNHPHLCDETPVGVGDVDGGREEKKKTFWKWPVLRFPRRRTGKYNLLQAEKDYKSEAGLYRRASHRQDEIDGGRKEAETVEKKKKSFWKRLVLPFRRKAARYDLVQAEKEFNNDSTSKVPLSAVEKQLEKDVQEKGHIFRHYKIEDKLGKGGFGFVYAGTRRKDGLKVAVKCSVKPPNMPEIRVPGYTKLLPAEISLTIMANKGPSVPQIIKLLDWEDYTNHYLMVMERPSPCMDLFKFLKLRGGSLDEKTSQQIMWQVIRAANVCCDRGVFHRDIKLENLLVNPDTMEVKLIDFGCGAIMKKSAFKDFCGTKEYFPPEFKIDSRYYAKPTTVWSLGILLFAMVCGALPSTIDLLMMSANIWTSPGLSKECCRMICDCLKPKPQERLALEEMHLHDWFKFME